MNEPKKIIRIRRIIPSTPEQKREFDIRKKIVKKRYPRGVSRALRVVQQIETIQAEMRAVAVAQRRDRMQLVQYMKGNQPTRVAAVYALIITQKGGKRGEFIRKCAEIIEQSKTSNAQGEFTCRLIDALFTRMKPNGTKPSQSEGQGNT